MQSFGKNLRQVLTFPLLAVASIALMLLVFYLEQHAEIGLLTPVFVITCLFYAGVIGFFALVAIFNMVRRRLILAVAAVLAASVMLFSVAKAATITEKAFYLIDFARFSISQDYYLKIIERDEKQVQRFPWGSGGFLGTNFFYSLLYRPEGSKFPASAKREGCTSTLTELRKNFYVESEICQ